MKYPEMIDPKQYDSIWKKTLPINLEEILYEKFKNDLIPFTSNYFEIFKHPESAWGIHINEENHFPFVYPRQWEARTTFPIQGEFTSKAHNVHAVQAHKYFLRCLADYIFGLQEIKERYFYYDSRALYDVVNSMRIVDGVDKTLVPYLKDGYKLKAIKYLQLDDKKIRIVLDHYNYPEPYFKKLLIFCIKYRAWPSFDIFLQQSVYPVTKVRIIRKETHDEVLGKSTDDNRGTMYQDEGIEICDYDPPYEEKSSGNIWTAHKEKHLVRSNGVMDF